VSRINNRPTDHYADVHIQPDPEMPSAVLLNATFGRLHLALVALESHSIGVSFPDAQQHPPNLGATLRLHGSEDTLKALMDSWNLGPLGDHLWRREIRPVPKVQGFYQVRRIQPKTNVDRLRRRYALRHGVDEHEVRHRIPRSVERRCGLPYLQLKSLSTGHHFRLFVRQEPCDEHRSGTFNTYGLSAEATLPRF